MPSPSSSSCSGVEASGQVSDRCPDLVEAYRELECLEHALVEERQHNTRLLEERRAAKEAHALDVSMLEKMLQQALAENERLQNRMAALEVGTIGDPSRAAKDLLLSFSKSGGDDGHEDVAAAVARRFLLESISEKGAQGEDEEEHEQWAGAEARTAALTAATKAAQIAAALQQPFSARQMTVDDDEPEMEPHRPNHASDGNGQA